MRALLHTAGFLAVYGDEAPMKVFLEKQLTSETMREGVHVGFQDIMDWQPSTEAKDARWLN